MSIINNNYGNFNTKTHIVIFVNYQFLVSDLCLDLWLDYSTDMDIDHLFGWKDLGANKGALA